jgi:capping protein beta
MAIRTGARRRLLRMRGQLHGQHASPVSAWRHRRSEPPDAPHSSSLSFFLRATLNDPQNVARSSPWTNSYDPPIDDGVLPPAHLRAFEESANDLFGSYMQAYYENGASSVYCWELDDKSFAACVLFKKEVEKAKKGLESGGWDAIHVMEVRPLAGGRANYKLTSTVMLRLATDHSTGQGSQGELKLSGSMTRQASQEAAAADMGAHLPNMGRMIEDMENRMRDSLQDVYFGKTRSTVNKLYKAAGGEMDARKDALASSLQQEMMRRGGAKHTQ